ncbi:Scr1 family TA system antitoxin-like transcriptional regulator [Kitasatospora purpeofusca]|uniref:Scr1 family TA system antitoxin-like transcriptional regulator n=1 Tax=Kitasatospora purpeofusca TaxID=67352 RepID=UPI0038602392
MTNDSGGTLRNLRQAAGKEAKAVARGAAMSPSKLSRIETGKAKPSTIDVERILTAIGVPDAVRADLVETARREATEAVAWRFLRRAGFHHHQDSIRAVEAETEVQRVFQPSCVPGLCQTPEYVRAVLAPKGLTPDVLARTVAARRDLHHRSQGHRPLPGAVQPIRAGVPGRRAHARNARAPPGRVLAATRNFLIPPRIHPYRETRPPEFGGRCTTRRTARPSTSTTTRATRAVRPS